MDTVREAKGGRRRRKNEKRKLQRQQQADSERLQSVEDNSQRPLQLKENTDRPKKPLPIPGSSEDRERHAQETLNCLMAADVPQTKQKPRRTCKLCKKRVNVERFRPCLCRGACVSCIRQLRERNCPFCGEYIESYLPACLMGGEAWNVATPHLP